MTAAATSRGGLAGATVLVVEDDPASARLATLVLRASGCEVHLATTATQATRLVFGGLAPSLVVMDLDLPDLTGMDLAKVFRSVEHTRDVPIVAVTASGLAFGERAALSAGCDGFIRKPIDVDAFPRQLEAYLRTGTAPRPARPATVAPPALKAPHEAILGAIAKAICVVRPDDLTVVYANRTFEQILGYTPEEVIGRPIAVVDIGSAPSTAAMRDAIRLQLDTRGEGSFEVPRVRADKPDFWVQVTVSRLGDPDLGELWLLVLDDISERKRAEADLKRALARSEAQFATLSDAGVIAIMTGDLAGEIRHANDEFLRIIGWSRDEVAARGLRADDFALPEYRRLHELAKEAVGQSGVVPPYEKEYRRKDGARVPVLVGGALLDESSFIGFAVDLSEKRSREAALRQTQRRFDALWSSGMVGVAIGHDRGRITEANDAYLAITGYTREDLAAGLVDYVQMTPPARQEELARTVDQILRLGFAEPWETETVRKDGSCAPVMIAVAGVGDGENLAIVTDLTARTRAEEQLRRTEEQLRQSQKMEAIGRLAGGVAHDFNNMLSVILSYSELLIDDLPGGDPMRSDLDEVRTAAMRASELTRQLLIFSRQQVVEPRVLDANEVLLGMERMLRRLLGEDVELACVPGPALGRIRADGSHLEQVILNLAVNARDAMPDGGMLSIETASVDLDRSYAAAHVPVVPGRYVMLAVSDTGCGMDRATQARIFDPFFTTKAVGKGTGLGLSTVFGIVQQSGGHIWVYSEPGRGSTFKLYFPRVDAEADRVSAPSAPTTLRGTEVILLVEDEEQVRRVAHGILTRYGYTVREAKNPGEALLICETDRDRIDLLVTDVVMPQMSGPELARRVARLRPGIPVLCMSGYTDDSVVRHAVLEHGVPFLQKPLTPEGLARKVRDVLDRVQPPRE